MNLYLSILFLKQFRCSVKHHNAPRPLPISCEKRSHMYSALKMLTIHLSCTEMTNNKGLLKVWYCYEKRCHWQLWLWIMWMKLYRVSSQKNHCGLENLRRLPRSLNNRHWVDKKQNSGKIDFAYIQDAFATVSELESFSWVYERETTWACVVCVCVCVLLNKCVYVCMYIHTIFA